jgi:hypothetical protein
MTPTRKTVVAMLAVALASTYALDTACAQSISSATASTSGSTGDSGDGDGSRRSSVGIQTNDGRPSRPASREPDSDVSVFGTRDTNGNAQHNLSFTVTATSVLPRHAQRTGDMNRISDAQDATVQRTSAT